MPTQGTSKNVKKSAATERAEAAAKAIDASGGDDEEALDRIAAQFRHADSVELDGASMEAAGLAFDISELDPEGVHLEDNYELMYRKGSKLALNNNVKFRNRPVDGETRNP